MCLLSTRARSNYCVKKRSEPRNGRDSRLSSTKCLNTSFQLGVLSKHLGKNCTYIKERVLQPSVTLTYGSALSQSFLEVECQSVFGGQVSWDQEQHKNSFYKHCIYRTQLKFCPPPTFFFFV